MGTVPRQAEAETPQTMMLSFHTGVANWLFSPARGYLDHGTVEEVVDVFGVKLWVPVQQAPQG